MAGVYVCAKRKAGYNATIFLSMISDPEMGGLRTAEYLIHTDKPSVGYVALYERGHLDLTVEALILQPEWDQLFSDDDRLKARQRLLEYRFDVDAYMRALVRGWRPCP